MSEFRNCIKRIRQLTNTTNPLHVPTSYNVALLYYPLDALQPLGHPLRRAVGAEAVRVQRADEAAHPIPSVTGTKALANGGEVAGAGVVDKARPRAPAVVLPDVGGRLQGARVDGRRSW